MSKVLDKLGEFINSSKISPDDQNDLLIFLPILPEESLENLLRIFKEEPKLLKDFNEDFKARLNILIDGRDKWDKLISKEEEFLEEGEREEKEDYYDN
ncbi:MAG: hypothetical protein PHW15_01225 [Patescibacteria group bacterium]|jgi:hypothetical protein|nr:hypothetical protein [Patescibacteria group bacterium]MDD5172565.1 hypothetical protein [Patescibacteria group bacterium]